LPLDYEWSQLLGENNNWTLQIVYDHSFPISRMGGSVKIIGDLTPFEFNEKYKNQ
jgi:hypothetical protein